ncbi:MAG: arsenate reductase ArsC [Casimicrobiaceae bacterium]
MQIPLNVLLLTGNSVRSILAERLLDTLAPDRFRAYSAGSHPGGTVNPHVVDFLREKDIFLADAHSKSWDAFAGSDAPRMDLVVTVCDQAAAEPCPIWPDHPARVHWSAPDPAAQHDPDAARQVIHTVYDRMHARILALIRLPVETLDHDAFAHAVRRIGATSPQGS